VAACLNSDKCREHPYVGSRPASSPLSLRAAQVTLPQITQLKHNLFGPTDLRRLQSSTTVSEEFRSLILDHIAKLERLIESTARDSAPVELDQQRVGRLSRMDALQSQAMSKETERRRRIELNRLRGALNRIDAGTFGACVECGEDISDKRLRHNPGNTLCIECARSGERR